jgi:hypothetical protein
VHAAALPAAPLRGQSAWVAASVAEVRARPAHTAEQVTQALQGEVLEPLVHEDGWVLARLPDRYIGWIRDWHVRLVPTAECTDFARRVAARVAVPLATLLDAPRPDAGVCGESPLGTRVGVRARDGGWAEVLLPGGRSGFLPDAALRPGTEPWPGQVASLLATLERFYGVPYLWGGKSPKGFDCSGLVQFAFELHGVTLPRDSDEQFECGEPVESPQAGDLLFFGKERTTHVAVALDAATYIHARGEVRRNALQPGTPGHDAELLSLWRGTRRVQLPAPGR